MFNKKVLAMATAALNKAKAPAKKKDIIVDPRGQWDHPGEVTRIPGNDITMQGVPYPVYGVDNTGYGQMMYPGQDYTFPGADHVDEYPQVAQRGGDPIKTQFGRTVSLTDQNEYNKRLQYYNLSKNLQNYINTEEGHIPNKYRGWVSNDDVLKGYNLQWKGWYPDIYSSTIGQGLGEGYMTTPGYFSMMEYRKDPNFYYDIQPDAWYHVGAKKGDLEDVRQWGAPTLYPYWFKPVLEREPDPEIGKLPTKPLSTIQSSLPEPQYTPFVAPKDNRLTILEQKGVPRTMRVPVQGTETYYVTGPNGQQIPKQRPVTTYQEVPWTDERAGKVTKYDIKTGSYKQKGGAKATCPEGYTYDPTTKKCMSNYERVEYTYPEGTDIKDIHAVHDLWPVEYGKDFTHIKRPTYIQPLREKNLVYNNGVDYQSISIYPDINYKLSVDPSKTEGYDKATNTYYVPSENTHQYKKYKEWEKAKELEKQNLATAQELINTGKFKLEDINEEEFPDVRKNYANPSYLPEDLLPYEELYKTGPKEKYENFIDEACPECSFSHGQRVFYDKDFVYKKENPALGGYESTDKSIKPFAKRTRESIEPTYIEPEGLKVLNEKDVPRTMRRPVQSTETYYVKGPTGQLIPKQRPVTTYEEVPWTDERAGEANEYDLNTGTFKKKKGGSVKSSKYSRSIEATNRLFHENKLTKKQKSKKKKIYDPYAKYFQEGGAQLPEDYSQFTNFNQTLPSNLQDPEYQYGNPDQYDLYGMWNTLGKPGSFKDVQDSDYFPLQDDGTYHGFSVGSDGTLLKPMSHSTTWKEVMNSQLNTDPYFKENRLIKNEQGRLQYVPNKQDGGVSPLEGNYLSKVIMNRNRGTDFVDRAYALGANPGTPLFNVPDDEQFGSWMSHKMAYGEDDSGKTWMFPTVLNPNNEAIEVPGQYADYISSEGYKYATGMKQKGGFQDDVNKRRRVLRDWTYGSDLGLIQAQKGLAISDLNEYKYRKGMYNDSLALYNAYNLFQNTLRNPSLTHPTLGDLQGRNQGWGPKILPGDPYSRVWPTKEYTYYLGNQPWRVYKYKKPVQPVYYKPNVEPVKSADIKPVKKNTPDAPITLKTKPAELLPVNLGTQEIIPQTWEYKMDSNPGIVLPESREEWKTLPGTGTPYRVQRPVDPRFSPKYNPATGSYQEGGSQDNYATKDLQEVKVTAPPPQWVQDKKKYGKDKISWWEAPFNWKKWGLNDYSDYSSFNSAFRNAREAGEKEFVYDRERYNTDLIDTKQSDIYWKSKEFVKNYYKDQPISEDRLSSIMPYYSNYKHGTNWLAYYDKVKDTPEYKDWTNPRNQQINDSLDMLDIKKDDPEFLKYAKNNQYNEQIKDLFTPSYFSITDFKPSDMSEDGYWDPKNNKTFMTTKADPGKLQTTYVHELSHKADDYIDILNKVPNIDIDAFNKSAFRNDFTQADFDYVSEPSEVEARKLSTLFYLSEKGRPYKPGKITMKDLDKLYDEGFANKLPYDIEQLLMLYGAQPQDLLDYLNSNYKAYKK